MTAAGWTEAIGLQAQEQLAPQNPGGPRRYRTPEFDVPPAVPGSDVCKLLANRHLSRTASARPGMADGLHLCVDWR